MREFLRRIHYLLNMRRLDAEEEKAEERTHAHDDPRSPVRRRDPPLQIFPGVRRRRRN